ncbi:MAG: VCBS repeat-containing protein [Verrucomicrobiae bacterium]|nr:VCBS repeat-containing protein [Verrucomicrobiae bacterium]
MPSPFCFSLQRLLVSTWRLTATTLACAGFVGLPSARAASDDEVTKSEPLATADHGPMKAGPERLFEAMPPEKTGVAISFPIEPDHELAQLYPFGWAAGGVAIGDINGDGKADLFFCGGPLPNRLYIQLEPFQFYDVTAQAGVSASDRWCSGAAMADIDNDGDLDIYVTCYTESNLMFVNESKGNQISFEEKAGELHIDTRDGSLNASFADFDRDGALDLYVQNYQVEPEKGRPEEKMEFTMQNDFPMLPERWIPYYVSYKGPKGQPMWTEAGRPDYFFRNKGFSFYEEFTQQSGIALGRAYGTSITWADVDHDGFPDLYIGNDLNDPDLFYRNSGRHNFTQASLAVFSHTPWYTRGTVAADFNNDLLIDLLASNAGGRSAAEDLAIEFPLAIDRLAMLNSGGTPQVFRNNLLINTGAARFVDTAWMSGLSHAGAVWSVKADDFDNDGWVDVFFANGSVRDRWQAERGALAGDNLIGKTRWDILKDLPERRETNLAFRNLGDLHFDDVSEAWGFSGEETMSYGSATGDLDGDGDLDLVVCNAGGEVTLYRNRSTANRVRLRLQGKKSNTWGIGAEIIATIGGRAQMRQLFPQNGFVGSDEPVVTFGLGDALAIDRLTIRWPSGAVETLENLEANREYTVSEAISLIPPLMRARRGSPMFVGSAVFPGIGSLEANSTESPQPLAPPSLSRMGPGLAWADIDGDGKDELYYGGSRERSGRLVSQSQAFALVKQDFGIDRNSEDLGAVFFDADNDKDLDLYVVSGGPEAKADSELLRDRLYLNDKLRFQKAPEGSLPDLRDSGGPVAAADFDRDGDVDLFVGGRLVPGAYPTAPKSRLLVNDGKAVFSHTDGETAAPGLTDSGMVTSAIWTDFDGDGWLDLILTRDWGGIAVWKNTDGKLSDVSAEAGTSELLGRWHGIDGGDIDQDGDIDYVVTNLGLNTSQMASAEQPLPVFYGDLIEDGKSLILETTRDAVSGKLLPRYDREIWSAAVPAFAEKYPTSRAFAEAAVGLDGAFPIERRNAALKLEVNTLETGLLINDGAGHFAFRPLPRLAQTSPGYGVVLTDVNLDGRLDCYLVQNQDRANVSADPADNGVGLLLIGTGRPEYPLQPVWPDESGLVVFGPSRGLAIVDLDDDDRADLVVGLSESDPAAFLNKIAPSNRQPLKVNLRDSDHHAAGARVTVQVDGLPDQAAEYHAGGGYLSQSPATLFFGVPKKDGGTSAKVIIRWADGEVTERTVYFE